MTRSDMLVMRRRFDDFDAWLDPVLAVVVHHIGCGAGEEQKHEHEHREQHIDRVARLDVQMHEILI